MEQPILVKLKMRAIYTIILSIIGILIIGFSILETLYYNYEKKEIEDGDIEVNGALSINYLSGKKFNLNAKDTKKIEFSVSNTSDSVSYYNFGFSKVRGKGKYTLKANDIVVMTGELMSIDEITTDYISIDANETKTYILEIENTENSILKGTLNIRTQNAKNETFADLIIKNSSLKDDTLTKVGVDEAITDEGLIKSIDDIGVSYYFRGDVNNNYVKFGNLNWRIVRINGDGSVRIILEGHDDLLSNYYNESVPNDFKESNIYTFLEEWLNLNLSSYTSLIANSRFCNDVSHDESNNYLSYSRIMVNKIPTLNCLGTTINNNIGLLSIDEIILAGASPTTPNQNYYLYDSTLTEPWYTMSGAKGSSDSLNLYMINTNGSLNLDTNGSLNRKIRPVINLIKNIEMVGDGSINNPYQLKEEKID